MANFSGLRAIGTTLKPFSPNFFARDKPKKLCKLPLMELSYQIISQRVHCCWAAIEVVIAAQLIIIAAASIGDVR